MHIKRWFTLWMPIAIAILILSRRFLVNRLRKIVNGPQLHHREQSQEGTARLESFQVKHRRYLNTITISNILTDFEVCALLDDEDGQQYRTVSNLDLFGLIYYILFVRGSIAGRCDTLCPVLCNHQPCRKDYVFSNAICTCFTRALFMCGADAQCTKNEECKCIDGFKGDPSEGCVVNNDLPVERIIPDDLVYVGAFRLLPGRFGGDDTTYSINYAVGTLAFDAKRRSLFIAGHSQQTRIAEYPVVSPGMEADVLGLPVTDRPLQDFFDPVAAVENPSSIDRITGLLVDINGELLVNMEKWYGTNNADDSTLIIRNATSMASSPVDGFYQLSCKQHCAGYMGHIPPQWRGSFGSSHHYTGWSSVYSITARYSQGPSLWAFDPENIGPTTPYLNYPYDGGKEQWLSERAVEVSPQGTPGPFPPADPLWNSLSHAVYGFFVKGTFCVIGSSGGLVSGIGYKAVRSDGSVCGGPCSYEPSDNYNYVWLYDVESILNASRPFEPRPYYFGIWDIPFQGDGDHLVIGGTYDEHDGILYVALSSAAQVGPYDRPPLIVTFSVGL